MGPVKLAHVFAVSGHGCLLIGGIMLFINGSGTQGL